MAKQTINIGAAPNDGTGTPLRTSFDYCNQNFTELYTATGPSGNNIVVPGSATITGAANFNGGALAGYLNGSLMFGSSGNTVNFFAQTSGFAFKENTGANNLLTISNAGVFGFLDGAGGTRMTLNSTGLGVGGSPDTGLFTVGSTGITSATTPSIRVISNKATFVITSDGATNTAGTTINYSWANGGQGPLIFRNNSIANVMTLDASGNVGVGVTPNSAWNAGGGKTIQLTANASLTGGLTNSTYLAQNWYHDNTNSRYLVNGFCMVYEQNKSNGAHVWYNSINNTLGAGAVATLNPAMTLDASGNLLVGVASSGNRLDIQKSTDCTVLVKSTGANTNIAMDYVSNYGNHTIRKSGTAVWDYGVINDSSATPAFKIQNPSAVGVQLVSGATAWTTLSDETTKDIIEPISNAVSKVGSLRSVIGKFKTDDASKRRSFLISQDVQSVLPEAVDVIGENNELGLRYTEVIPLLVAAIKELSAEVNALKNA